MSTTKQPTIKDEVRKLHVVITDVLNKVGGLKSEIDKLNIINIKVKNGKEQTIMFNRSDFFQMLYDRKKLWKEKLRVTFKDILLIGGVVALISDRIWNIF